jgi:serine/threonine protein kinase
MIRETVAHYRILQELGSGGMGIVYKAEDLRLGRSVAIKFLPDQWSKHPDALERFRIEARAASALNHPHICTIYDIGEHDGRPFIVMEYLQGETLKDRIKGTPLRTEEILDLGIQIADALRAAHTQRIIHRDVKPTNVFVTAENQAKILDFGLAKFADQTSAGLDSTTAGKDRTTPGTALGTLAYMSPEQARAEELDERTDLFSFGAVLYEMASGVQAFTGTSTAVIYDAILNRTPTLARRLNPSIPIDLNRIIEKTLEKEPRFRYQHASEVRADLERLRRDLTSRSMVADQAEIEIEAGPRRHTSQRRKGLKRAFVLGLIPGVGAIYNGQYKKAALHVLAFGVLSVLSNIAPRSLYNFFELARLAFIAYMAFDTYRTAQERNQ